MIPKRLEEIKEDDLLGLISNEVPEGRTIDYKSALPGNGDGDKKEFLADVSSFANTSGGDLVFGMEEAKGLPIQIVGLKAADSDMEIRRLDSIVASGLDPRIRYATRLIDCKGGMKALVIRVERSWSGPHRVVFKGHDKFYGRNSAGKYPLDVNELRTAFTLASTVTERIRAFRTDRIIALMNNETPVPFVEGPKIVLHCIPIESFASQPLLDILPISNQPVRLRPMRSSSWNHRLNLEGVLAFDCTAGQLSASYTQVYRNGVIEAVEGRLLAAKDAGRAIIPSVAYEKEIWKCLESSIAILKSIGANSPIVVALTLTNTRGLSMSISIYESGGGYPIDKDLLILPETLVEDMTTPLAKVLKPMFDLVWNACGYPSSKNFDANGNWVQRS